MSIKEKLKKLFKRQKKESRTAGAIVWGSGGTIWPNRDYENFAKETYMKNIISFGCIHLIAKSIASVPWNVYKKNSEGESDIIPEHPLNSVLKRANPHESFNFLTYEVIAYLLIAGNSYIERVSPETGPNKGIPKELYSLRPDRMKIKVDETTGLITAYEYEVNGQFVLYEVDPITQQADVLHLKTFNPLDDFYGAAITESAAREIDTFNSSTAYNKNLMDNQARPGMLMIFDENLSDKQYDRLERSIRENREGTANAGKSMIIEGATEVKPYGFTPEELDFIQTNIELARRIAFAYGVPAQMLGIPDANTYSNYKEARLSFWEETVIWYLNFLKGELNNWFFEKDETVFLDYSLDDVPAMSLKRDALWTRAQETEFLTTNEKREMVGMDVLEEGGDEILVQSTLMPLSMVEGTMEIDDEEEDEFDFEEMSIKILMKEGYTREEAKAILNYD